MRMPRVLTRHAVAATSVAVMLTAITAAPASAATLRTSTPAQPVQQTATVVGISDGDTVYVDIWGDGSSVRKRVRLTGINAAEVNHGVGDHPDQCHGPEAEERLRQLVYRKKVQLRALDAGSTSGSRLRRTVLVEQPNGSVVNTSKAMVAEGHALWMPNETEYLDNAALAELAAQAAGRQVGLHDPDYCGYGSAQSVALDVRVRWDADAKDGQNLNDEYVIVTNTSAFGLDLTGWVLRDSFIKEYAFPRGTNLRAGRTLFVHVGSGQDSGKHLYMGETSPKFNNVDRSRGIGDGAYIFDPDGDLRFSFLYPCQLNCVNPSQDRFVLGEVNYDAPGGDSSNPGGEFIKLHNRGYTAVPLGQYLLRFGPYSYSFMPRATLAPGATVKVVMGKGRNTSTHKYVGKPHGVLSNSGGRAQIATYDDVVLDCAAWKAGSC
ncbi:MAG: lamin tail domain-containing protein [Actinomycetota bacterium]|nr:lamin tail domain-containing protein [Acidothermales bacterium]MDQ3431349.1 lamin tail domain-containing protein [Actinomycetota bacterium]